MANQPQTVALAFASGNNLPILNANSVSVKIITQMNADGTVKSATLQMSYQIDTDFLTIPPLHGDGEYVLPDGAVGFNSNTELFNNAPNNKFYVNTFDQVPYLTAELPLDGIKRYVEADE